MECEVSEVERMESIVQSLKSQLKDMNNISSNGESCKRIINHIQQNSSSDHFVVAAGGIESEKNRFHTSMDAGGGCCVIS